MAHRPHIFAVFLVFNLLLVSACSDTHRSTALPDKSDTLPPVWTLEQSNHSVRHEAGLVAHNNKMFLLGGRGERPFEVYDVASNTWQTVFAPREELHHFQPVSLNGLIYIMGALTGPWPDEEAVAQVLTYNPDTQTLLASHAIPDARKRGAAGLVAYQNELYMLGGLTNGHMGGSVPWFDKYNPNTGAWHRLPDAPTARDHFQAVVIGHKLYAVGGRQTSHATGEGMSLTQAQIDVYDFNSHTWETLPQSSNLPIPRAGNMAIALGQYIMFGGGESALQADAHNEVSLFDTQTSRWRSFATLQQGRHGSGFARLNNTVYTVSGSGKAGGEPELESLESIDVSGFEDSAVEHTLVSFGQAMEINIEGPQVSELDTTNPFTDYLMQVELSHNSGQTLSLQGYFAADGNAANTGADTGNLWQAKFTAQRSGDWHYRAALYQGNDVVFADKSTLAKMTPIAETQANFVVGDLAPNASFFAKNGQISIHKGYFFFPHTQRYWIKAGSNSPENFLAYHEVDATYRASQQAREGEAKAPDFIHEFAPHVKDWREGDPLWQGTKGKGIIGAINYMADTGMQAQYFLSMNIDGDGRDVWPYTSHDEFERFDVSKLAQWDVIFKHMQNRDMLIHLVTQETENELLLDNGNTERLRKLYYRELITRFGYHNGLIWNLGEENGPAEWSPQGQTSEQRIAMSAYFANNDAHGNPIFLHTLPSPHDKDNVLPDLYESDIQGLSFQVDDRTQAPHEIHKWRQLSKENNVNGGDGWVITMDEIGMWQIGAKVDGDDPTHDSLRRHALWGSLMAGASGVEWYFGAHQPHNDLSSEDFRVRENLWKQTRIAADFFSSLALTELELIADGQGLYHAKTNTIQIVYLAPLTKVELALVKGNYEISWLNPINAALMHQADLNIETDAVQAFEAPGTLASTDLVLIITKL